MEGKAKIKPPKKVMDYLAMRRQEAFRTYGYGAVLEMYGFTKAEAFRCRAYLEACCDDKFKEIVNRFDTKTD